jgi:hypothetical protein
MCLVEIWLQTSEQIILKETQFTFHTITQLITRPIIGLFFSQKFQQTKRVVWSGPWFRFHCFSVETSGYNGWKRNNQKISNFPETDCLTLDILLHLLFTLPTWQQHSCFTSNNNANPLIFFHIYFSHLKQKFAKL